MEERYQLSRDRIQEIQSENVVKEPFSSYFKFVAGFILEMDDLFQAIKQGVLKKENSWELMERNHFHYRDILEQQYESSYANPTYGVEVLGKEYGPLLSFLYTEIRSLIPYAYEQKIFEMTIRMELFLEVYHSFCYEYGEEEKAPDYESIKQIIYWFISDYSEPEMESRIKEQLRPEESFATDIIMNSDLSDSSYLFLFGEYITENEIRTTKHLNQMDISKIKKMADTFTEGYRMGFVNGNKDLSKKKVVNIRYSLGFERVIKEAILNFKEMGLEPTIYRAGVSIFHKKSNLKIGYYGAIANKQYEFDHKEDEALYYDKLLMNRKLEIMKEAYEQEKEWAGYHGGPACMEVFGEMPFVPKSKKESCKLTEVQQKLAVIYGSEAGQIVNEYIRGDERSFTIIAFPVPEIGPRYEEIFDEVVKINTLDYKIYEEIQQSIIDVLDQAEHVIIKGCNGNETSLKVMLHEMANPLKETIFENCVADVNIPVGEVFTSPKLEGTNGILHVSTVFLNELEYKDLKIVVEDGLIKDYSCNNFKSDEENRTYIKDNILFHHDMLPLGEFAIGTNTTAYVVAKKYGIADKLPILIAEKMGPHFAFGDTCYSHSEDVKVYNPNGKEIIAKENSISKNRTIDHGKAYFNCHTDITIPYEELGSLVAVKKDGTILSIIENGRFVLKSCEKLNEPFITL